MLNLLASEMKSLLSISLLHVVRCAIWYHVHNLNKVKNTHGGVLLLVKLQTEACNVTKINYFTLQRTCFHQFFHKFDEK